MRTSGLYLITLIVIFFAIVLMANAATVSVQTPIGPYPSSVAANDLDITLTAAVNVSTATTAYDSFACTGAEILLIQNTAGITQGVTINSVATPYGRENDIINYQLGASEIAAFKITNTVGWKNSSGVVEVQAASADMYFAVLKFE